MAWPVDALTKLLGTELPIIQAPMAGAQDSALAVAVCRAGGLGSLPCAMLSAGEVHAEIARIRGATDRPFNVNFFCHRPPPDDPGAEHRWRQRLTPYYREYGIAAPASAGPLRRPFGEEMCALVEEMRPPVVSFHFGLPEAALLQRVRATGAVVLSSATTLAEARWLAARGVDAVIAQGWEAGGHRGMFLTADIAAQVGTMALVPQIADAVDVPVIAAGGIADGRGIAAAFALGAAGVQIGTAFLRSPESRIPEPHRAAIAAAAPEDCVLTNIFSGRPARGVVNRAISELGPISAEAPPFPLAGTALAPLRAAAESAGSGDFTPLWAGQGAALATAARAGEILARVGREAQSRLAALAE